MLITAAVSSGVVGDRPSGAVAAGNHRRKKTSVRIFGDDLDLLLVARDVTKTIGLSGRNGGVVAQLVAAPIIHIYMREVDIANLPTRVINNTDRCCRRCGSRIG